jgi:hypothetical protein
VPPVIGETIQQELDLMVAIKRWRPWLARDQGRHLGMPSVIRNTIQQGLGRHGGQLGLASVTRGRAWMASGDAVRDQRFFPASAGFHGSPSRIGCQDSRAFMDDIWGCRP